MDLKKIVTISGKPGLYELMTQNQNSIIVRNIDSGKRMAVGGNQQVSVLENITVFGFEGEYPLAEVFQKIFDAENGSESISHKSSSNELRVKMEEVLPDYDRQRVYDSDIKKIFQWYNLLHKNDKLKPSEKSEEEALETQTDEQ